MQGLVAVTVDLSDLRKPECLYRENPLLEEIDYERRQPRKLFTDMGKIDLIQNLLHIGVYGKFRCEILEGCKAGLQPIAKPAGHEGSPRPDSGR